MLGFFYCFEYFTVCYMSKCIFQNDISWFNWLICRYGDIVQRQKMLWEAKYQALAKQLKIPKEHEKKFKDKGMVTCTLWSEIKMLD